MSTIFPRKGKMFMEMRRIVSAQEKIAYLYDDDSPTSLTINNESTCDINAGFSTCEEVTRLLLRNLKTPTLRIFQILIFTH